MRHPIFRNLSSRDTLFGLDLTDLVIMAAITNLIFRFHNPAMWTGKILNIVLILMSYLGLVVVKRQFAPGYLKNRFSFLFRNHRLRAMPEEKLKPLGEVRK